ncbi:hypothetical protein C8T65DRAFT_626125 [Cerioporus squamosus]|nr:hypothetical protein C8T65DRAFT_626125 [Cerioporus squamosus]
MLHTKYFSPEKCSHPLPPAPTDAVSSPADPADLSSLNLLQPPARSRARTPSTGALSCTMSLFMSVNYTSLSVN